MKYAKIICDMQNDGYHGRQASKDSLQILEVNSKISTKKIKKVMQGLVQDVRVENSSTTSKTHFLGCPAGLKFFFLVCYELYLFKFILMFN